MTACGPRPIADGAPDVLVNFFPGSWGEFDFECVELAMRYLYLVMRLILTRQTATRWLAITEVIWRQPSTDREWHGWDCTPGG